MRSLLSASILAGAIGWLTLTWPGQATAQGTEFNLSCNDDEVLVGIRGRQGWWMEGIGIRCRAVQSNGQLGDNVHNRGYRGGNGGTLRTYDCPPDEVMVGYSGSQGDNGYVLNVQEVVCAPWNADTRTAGMPTSAVRAFDDARGSGRGISATCVQGKVGTHLRGRAGIYLDRLTDIGCSYAGGATPPVASGPQPPPPPRPRIAAAPIPIGSTNLPIF